MNLLKIHKNFHQFSKKYFGISSFYSKYVIIGTGFAGMTLAKLMTSSPYGIKGEEITLIDEVCDYTVFPKLKYHCFAVNLMKDKLVSQILPNKVKLRQNEVLSLDVEKKLLLGSASLRQSYDKLILASGLVPDYVEVPGLLFSLKDNQNPIFTMFEYQNCIPKLVYYSHRLIKNTSLSNEYNVTIENDLFYRTGKGNIIICNVGNEIFDIIQTIQTVILLYDLVYKKREKEFVKNVQFKYFLPISKEQFINDNSSNKLNTFFIKLLEDRNIDVNWNYKLKSVGGNQTLSFTTLKTNSEQIIEYNYAIITPRLILPSFIRYSNLFSNNSKLDYDLQSLQINNSDVFLIGDCIQAGLPNSSDFLHRFDTNIFLQALILSNNFKVNHYLQIKNKLRNYAPNPTIYLDYSPKEYMIFNTASAKDLYRPTSIAKGLWIEFLFSHLYFRPEGFYAQRMLLQRKFDFNFKNII